ncbi:FHA domain-containing protein [Nocardioides campestrisoli]|uniref:FHA domain-containing protein n=1 Tax=Nocardioides campestrisoli TaxID=2736757 RepID=UPI0015E7C401|nr:FHA domain-containing protein [Nocardioides campestrisoli]
MNDVKNRASSTGTWLALLGPELTLLLPGREKARAAELWAEVDEGARFEAVLDALLAPGLQAVSEFVLVAVSGGSARVLVRGGATVSVHTDQGTTEVTAGDRLWAEESFATVTAMVATLPDSEEQGTRTPVREGLVRVGSLAWGEAQQPEQSVQAVAPQPVADPVVEPVAEPVAEPVSEPVGRHVSTPTPAPVPGMTVPPLPSVPAFSVPKVAAPAAAAAPAPAAAAETGEIPIVPGFEHDGLTQIGEPQEEPAPLGIPGQPQAPQVTARPVARLVFSHGTTTEVDRAVLVGRAPEARRFAPGDQPQLVTVPSPNQEVSSTHLEIRPGSGVDHGSAVATDLGSTNGTLLVQPGLPPEDLQPGMAVQLIPGAILDLGDGVTIQVTQP